jgi:hypothetical protein
MGRRQSPVVDVDERTPLAKNGNQKRSSMEMEMEMEGNAKQ